MSSNRSRIIGLLIIITTASTLIASAESKVEHTLPRSQLKKRQGTKPFPPPKPFVSTFDLEQQQYLVAHNTLRAKVGVPLLTWNPTLTTQAHAWAEQRKGDCNYRQHSSNPYGENIFWMNYKEFVPKDVVQSWFDEYKWYDHKRNVCTCYPERAGCECGHYLAVVWKSTRQVGCSGAVYCDNQKGVYVVCNYDPAGVIKGVNPLTGAKV
ncbi:hypothetical protein ACJIZ3_024185 [Penstemon smallii]|uniref:SCP domain-containing protein n=1 Tax=Penstemon smallii TaxID=265156 RepID=A0ABD3TR56_9LAMI